MPARHECVIERAGAHFTDGLEAPSKDSRVSPKCHEALDKRDLSVCGACC